MSPEVKTFYYIVGKFVWVCDLIKVTKCYPLAGHGSWLTSLLNVQPSDPT